MTWIREVGHVLMKDVRESRRLALLYLVVVCMATAHGAGLGVFARGAFGPSMIFVVIVGALLVASVIQSDSPTRPDAFWATHPFRRSAMLSAKVCFGLLVVAFATIGQVIAVRSYDLHGRAMALPVLGPALLFAVALLGVMLLAALSRDLRSFALAAIAIPLVALITVSTVPDRLLGAGETKVPLQVLGIVAAAVLLGWLYLARDGRRRTRIGGYALVASTLVTMCSKAPTSNAGAPLAPVAPPLASLPTVSIDPLDPRVRLDPRRLQVAFVINGLVPGMRARVSMESADIRLRDGTAMHVPMENSYFDFGASWPPDAVAPRIAGVRWLGDSTRPVRRMIAAELTPVQWQAVMSGMATVTMNGRLQLWESRAAETLPLVVGHESTRNGYRTRIVEWTPGNEKSMLVVDASFFDTSVSGAPSPSTAWADSPNFVLVNEPRHEAVLLYHKQGAGSLDGLVLPGARFRSQRTHYALSTDPRATIPALDDAWFRDARLRRVSSDFRGSQPFSLALEIPGVVVPPR